MGFACQQWCTETWDCDCVVWNQDGGQCWRRKDCRPSNFYHQDGFSVFMKMGSAPAPTPPSNSVWYNTHWDRNCWTNHGAVDIDTAYMHNAPRKRSQYACQQWCTETWDCDCVVWHQNGGQCWRRKHCNPSNFYHQDGFTVFMKMHCFTQFGLTVPMCGGLFCSTLSAYKVSNAFFFVREPKRSS